MSPWPRRLVTQRDITEESLTNASAVSSSLVHAGFLFHGCDRLSGISRLS